MGTFQEDLETMQAFHAGRISRREAIERFGLVKDVDEEMRRIVKELSTQELVDELMTRPFGEVFAAAGGTDSQFLSLFYSLRKAAMDKGLVPDDHPDETPPDFELPDPTKRP